jgi:aminopeptidase N
MRPLFLHAAWLVLLITVGCSRAHPDVEAPKVVARAFPSAPRHGALLACPSDGSLDVLRHTIELRVQLAPSASILGTGEILLRARRDVSTIALDAQNLRVATVSRNSRSLDFRQVKDRICVDLNEAFSKGSEIALRLRWEVPIDNEVPHFSNSDVWAGYGTSAWMPTVQDPAQRATLQLAITADSALLIGASGRAGERRDAGAGLIHQTFTVDLPSPPFLYGFAVGRFSQAELTVDGFKLRVLGPIGADLTKVLTLTAPMYRFLASHIGAALATPEYLQVLVQGDAAQEAAGLSFISVDALKDVQEDPTEDWIFAHELAHQWFGWLVACDDFSDFWLNEGFATFMVAAVKEDRWGHAAYEREVALWRERSAKVHADGLDMPVSLSRPGSRAQAPLTETDLQARGITYSRGALVLHKLRMELGDVAFWAAIRYYVAQRSGKGARAEDLRSSLEAVTHKDLSAFFEKWVYTVAPDL